MWLSLVGLYGWEGVNPVPPELFLLPSALPFHPDQFYCHTRYIYLAIAYLYGRRFTGDLGPITAELRRELYAAPYESLDFAAHRHAIAGADVHVRPGLELRLAYDALRVVERAVPAALRRRALDHAYERIGYELEASRFQCISPVNGLLNCLCVFDREGEGERLAQALRGVEAWRWQDEAEGVRFAGARSNAWDTAFALRAALDPAPRSGLEGGGAGVGRGRRRSGGATATCGTRRWWRICRRRRVSGRGATRCWEAGASRTGSTAGR